MFSPDRQRALRRLLNDLERQLFERALTATSRALRRAADDKIASTHRTIDAYMAMLGKLLHEEANAIADKDRGPFARPLTASEQRIVVEAYGNDPDPRRVRIVRGPGLSLVAAGAFLNGNPAITVGNTIYAKSSLKYLNHAEWTKSELGIDLLVHEYSHVVQYHRLGFANFGKRYARELRAANYDPDTLYDYKHRKTHFGSETLEGQAEMAGNLARARRHSDAKSIAEQAMLKRRMAGSGVYGL